MIGTRIGNYRVVEKIGDGGMGTVYTAMDEMLDRQVALKVMRPELTRQASLHERFRQEAIALARLNHPNIASVFGLERNGEDLVMIMEFVRGETLESIVQRSGALSWTRAFELGSSVLEALDHAHDKGVVHRDIKPANIMLTRDGVVKVMDFGIARIMGRTRQTRVGAAVGTPMYMSPEQLKGEEVDGRSDLYSLAAVLFELITGRMAFEADSDYELMMKQLNEPAPPVRSLVRDVPEVVDLVLQRATAKRRESRHANAREMRAALHNALSQAPIARRPAVETRLASPSPVIHDASMTTRENPPLAPVAYAGINETRLAPESAPAPTRVAPGVTPAAANAAASRWLFDWRTWAGSAALFVVIALTIRGARAGGTDLASDTTRARDTSVVQAIVPGSLADTTGQGARREVAAAAAVSSASPSIGNLEGLKPLTPEPNTPTRTAPPAGNTTQPRTPRQADAPVTPPPNAPVAEPRREPAEARVEPAPQPAPSREEASSGNAESAIGDALHAFGASVTEGSLARVEPVLEADGDLSKQWVDLMKEGRLQMSVSGSPDIDVNGARATARFAASLNVRSAFGANKRRTGQFVAELSRSGATWRVVRVRPVGGLSLK